MSAVSKFSTPENYAQLTDALAKVDEALREAELAQQAGIAQAADLVKQAKDAQASILQIRNTYFPSGAPTEG